MTEDKKRGRGRPQGLTRPVAAGYSAAEYVASVVEREGRRAQKRAVLDAIDRFKVKRSTIYRWLPYERLMRRPPPRWYKGPLWPRGEE